MAKLKFLALILVTAILCLTIGNAVTGHGIKGNSNLNVTVLANETGTGTGDDSYKYDAEETYSNVKIVAQYYEGDKHCTEKTADIDRVCVKGNSLRQCESALIKDYWWKACT